MTRHAARRDAAVALAAIAITAAVAVAGCGGKPADPQAAAVAARFKGIPQHGVSLGNPTAPVALAEFADLKCPYCKKFSDNILPTLVNRYIRTGKLRIEFRNVAILDRLTPLPESTNAAKMAGAMTLQSKLWNFADLFYMNQRDETKPYVTDDFLRALAERVPGTDVNKAMIDRENPLANNFMVDATQRFAAIGSPGTPTFEVEKHGETPVRIATPSLTDPNAWMPVIEQMLQPSATAAALPPR